MTNDEMIEIKPEPKRVKKSITSWQDILIGKTASELYVEIEEDETGSYKITKEVQDTLGLATNPDGVLQYANTTEGETKTTESRHYTKATVAATAITLADPQVSLVVTADEIWEIVSLQAAFHISAMTSSRTATIIYESLGFNQNLYTPTNLFDTGSMIMTSDSDGYIMDIGDGNIYFNNNNLVSSDTKGILPIIVYGGAEIQARINTNPSVGDTVSLDILYRKL